MPGAQEEARRNGVETETNTDIGTHLFFGFCIFQDFPLFVSIFTFLIVLKTCLCGVSTTFSRAENTPKHPENNLTTPRTADRRICDDPLICPKNVFLGLKGAE